MRRFLSLFFALILPSLVSAQGYDIAGRVLTSGSDRPVGQAVVELPDHGLWAVADNEGRFRLKGVPAGATRFAVSCLGYVTAIVEVRIEGGRDDIVLHLSEDNLTLESVVVTAKESSDAMATTRTIGSNALDHLQMVNASDIASLLPGGKTVNPDLTAADTPFSLRGGGSDAGNASFGTAVEVDGVRLSTNASLDAMSGVSTRNIASTNIEAVEVVTGVPSAEYGDLTSGMVRISTRKGKTPYTVVLSTNPRTKQVSASKGFDLGHARGVLNSNVEYTRATKNPASPYTSYSRTGLSLNYSNTFAEVLRFNFGATANIGGMNTDEDPDAMAGQWEKARDNALRANTSLKWQLNRKWITSVDFEASVSYADNLVRTRKYESMAVARPAVHSEQEGYFVAAMLPATYYSLCNVDSKQLDYSASLKATWVRHWGGIHSNAKIGAAWRADGNVGKGAFYDDPALAPDGYRPRPYTDIPYMHNLAAYVEEVLTVPIGRTSLQLMAGLRAEKTWIKHSSYKNTASLSPRLNFKYRISEAVAIRGGWGVTEKLPSFNILYPLPRYRDTRVFSTTYSSERSIYVYHTQPYEVLYNENLRWQRNRNAEVGVDLRWGELAVSLAGYFNRTKFPYELSSQYDPFAYRVSELPAGYQLPKNPTFRVDPLTGEVLIGDADNLANGFVPAASEEKRTFVQNTMQDNGSAVDRMGLEFVVDFPQINPIRTQLRLDGAYAYTKYVNEGEACYYPATTSGGVFYPYAGVYADNGGQATITYNGRRTHTLDANLTATTHLPSIRMIITLRLEMSLLKRSQNLSEYGGREYAFNVDEDRRPTGGSIYDGNSYTAVWPLAYIDLDGQRHPFTETQKSDPAFAALLLRSANAFTYNADGYDPYFSANLSITKEIGDHVSISFYANNFTNSRPFLKSYATGVARCMTPDFYYGLTVRLKF